MKGPEKTLRGPEEILRVVCGYLNEKGVEYVIVGGFAVMYHGRPRATADMDLVVAITDADIGEFTEFLLENDFFASEEDMRDAFAEGSHCTVEDRGTLFRLDLKRAASEMDRRTLHRRIAVDFDGLSLHLASAEDTVLNKLLFGRELDFDDALSICVRRSGKLDRAYIEEQSRKRGCYDSWRRLRSVAEAMDERD